MTRKGIEYLFDKKGDGKVAEKEKFRKKVKKDLIDNRVIVDEEDLITSDGITARYYELPPNAKEIQDLISYKNMNAQMGEIGRAWYRYGECSHSDEMRELNKIIFYAEAEKDRLRKYGKSND